MRAAPRPAPDFRRRAMAPGLPLWARTTESGIMREYIWQLLDSRSIGGIETHVRHLAGALANAGIPVGIRLVADHGPHPLVDQCRRDGVDVRALSGGLRGIRAALRAERPTLVHTHGYKAGILGRVAAHAADIPCVSTFHAGDPGRGRVRLWDWLDRLSAPLAGARIAVSAQIARRVLGGAWVLPNFVPVPPVPTATGAAVAFVGRLSIEKGPDLFCDLARRLPDQRFEMHGDGPMATALTPPANLQRCGAAPDMDRRWPGIGLLVVSSRHEGLPMVVLEAMARGIPVAAFDVGAIATVVEDGRSGWIARPGDLDGLATAIRRWQALTPGARTAMGAAARQRIVAAYGPAAGLGAVRGVYATVG